MRPRCTKGKGIFAHYPMQNSPRPVSDLSRAKNHFFVQYQSVKGLPLLNPAFPMRYGRHTLAFVIGAAGRKINPCQDSNQGSG